MLIRNALFAVVAFAAAGTSAHAAGYDVSPIGEKGAYMGCMSINATTDVTFVGVENVMSVIFQGSDFKVDKDEKVSGTWSVDGNKERPLADKANGKGIVSVDMNATIEALEMFGNGKQVEVTVGKSTMTFDLTDSRQGLADLGKCMDKISR